MACKHPKKKPRSLPYGATKGYFWCRACDKDLVSDWSVKPLKKKERQKAKKEINKYK